MKLTDMHVFDKARVVAKTLGIQVCLFVGLLVLVWGSQAFYGVIDTKKFPQAYTVGETANLSENDKGKLLVDSVTNQLRREMGSTFGWTMNDIVFNRFVLDNRAYRQYGVYHATRVLMDLYSTQIAKLGSNDRESEFLYQARLNGFAVDPRSFMFPSAEGSYKKALNTVVGENMLGYALGLLADAQDIPFYTLDNRIYEVQGMVLVIRDFVKALYDLYPEIAQKNNAENMAAAMQFMNDICTYDPMYITSSFNSGELIISYLMFTKNRLEDIRDSLRI